MTLDKNGPHGRKTRLLHMSIALLVIAQVTTSEFMITPGKERVEDILFEIHEYTGIATFFLVFGFWIYTLIRAGGTSPALLFPWFSASRRAAFWADTKHYFKVLSTFGIPEHVRNGPLASAIHGLGIVLIAAMASTGVAWFIAIQLGDTAKWWGDAAKETHEIFSNLVWVYLIGHAGIALVNQFAGKQPLSDMWSLRK